MSMSVLANNVPSKIIVLLLIITAWKASSSFSIANRRRQQQSSKFSALFQSTSPPESSSSIIPPPSPKDDDNKHESRKSSSASSNPSRFSSFSYTSQWYPVSWERDVPVSKGTKVRLFDVDYVITKIPKDKKGKKNSEMEILALVDRCPHKSAALSEGRITSCGNFQCAYHGWSFDGRDGSCVEIPQVLDDGNVRGGGKRSSATAIPTLLSQGMIWIFPGPIDDICHAPPPPIIPEMNMPEFKSRSVVRDFPVDWTILLENIMDPDHGLFAHGAYGFDFYSASSTSPQRVVETFVDEGRGWSVTSTVDAVYKLRTADVDRRRRRRRRRGGNNDNDDERRKKQRDAARPPPKIGELTYHAPCVVSYCRRDAASNNGNATTTTNFLTAFWVCPTGTGTSRFMSAAIGKVPFLPPRWFFHLNINNFLDQDTFLLATTQRHVLRAEAEATTIATATTAGGTTTVGPRKGLYVYRSPSERMAVRVASFFDETLGRVPNRGVVLRERFGGHRCEGSSSSSSSMMGSMTTREVVLDRYGQHTSICQDSMRLVRNCLVVKRLTTIIGTVGLLSLMTIFRQRKVSTRLIVLVAALLGMVREAADRLRREFYFKYDESFRDRDLNKIPKVWMDSSQRKE